MTRPLVRAVFVVLVVATVAAFFTTQQLKSEFPLVIRFATKPAHFSPNGDDYRDTTEVGFDLSEPASVTFLVVDSEGSEVRRIVSERRLEGDAKHRFRWDGRDDAGKLVDGTYRMRVVRRDESRVIDSAKEITVDRKPPRVTLLSATPSVVATGLPGETPSVRLRYRGPKNRAPVVRVFRTDDGKPHIVQALPRRPQPRGRLGRPGERGVRAHRPGAGGRLRLHGRRPGPSRERDRGPAPGAAGGGRSSWNRRLGAPLHAAWPLSAVTAGRLRAPRGRTGGPQLRLGRVPPRGSQGRSSRRPGRRALSHPHPEQDEDGRLLRPRPVRG